ncbi:hypothetical protein GCM10010193_07000 [Kitasatospora atroaurantiaca]|uniref:Uncharacterized protein n=1 Tax=Kitasatospora atroaurantiaca TaxID=285545 RepID=A0A561EJ87_9ACTN|nr:hypothetical protein [Kitasatospora atroaurantiaca]TWE15663.1 hypothetical protein FB465_0586 [Kitasatospora atroaurantiaca]
MLVGVRGLEQVEAEIVRLESVAEAGPQVRGALAGYRWAAGRRHVGPVSGATLTSEVVPSDAQLRGEERAARATSNNPLRDQEERDFARGVVRALAWVLGESAEHP